MRLTLQDARHHWADIPAGLRGHMDRVSGIAAELARQWDLDPEEAALAGFLHDIARARPAEVLLRQAEDLGLTVDPVQQALPVLLHGPVGAAELARLEHDLGEDLLAAVDHHSTGREGMSQLEKVVFLADKLDPRQVGPDPQLVELRDRAFTDLDSGIIYYLEQQCLHLLQRGGLVHPAAIEARNWLLLQRRGTRL